MVFRARIPFMIALHIEFKLREFYIMVSLKFRLISFFFGHFIPSFSNLRYNNIHLCTVYTTLSLIYNKMDGDFGFWCDIRSQTVFVIFLNSCLRRMHVVMLL